MSRPLLHGGPGARTEGPERPAGVALFAGFQIFKATILLLAGLLLRWKPDAVDTAKSVLYPLLYIATRGRYAELNAATQGGNVLPGLLLLLGLYLGAIGIGLWRVQRWARRSLMLTCGLTLLLWAKTTLMPDPGAAVSPDLLYFHILIVLDTLMFVCLMRGNTAMVFEEAAA